MLPILVEVGHFTLHTYGVLVAAGYLAAITYVLRYQKRMGLSEEQLWGLIYALFFGALAGGKIGYAFTSWSEGWGFWRAIANIRYGFVFYGGVLGSIAAGGIYVRVKKLAFRRLADPFGAGLPLGHAIGRLGCFAAGCCYGAKSSVPWAVRFTDPASLIPTHLLAVPLHPVQIYESIGNLAIAAFVHFRWLRKTGPVRSGQGRAFGAYLILYAALRFVMENYRADDRGAFLAGLSPSQWTAFFMAAGGLWLLRGKRGRG